MLRQSLPRRRCRIVPFAMCFHALCGLCLPAAGQPATAPAGVDPAELKEALAVSKKRFNSEAKTQWTDVERAAGVARLLPLLARARERHAADLSAAQDELARARAAYDADRAGQLEAYEAAVHAYNWRITGGPMLNPVTDLYAALRDWHVVFDIERNRPAKEIRPEFRRWAFEGYRWVDDNVWRQMAPHPKPTVPVDRAYLKKPKIKLAMCGDSITEYADPARTMLEYLDDRFEVLDCGLSGHSIGNWFTSPKSESVRQWGPDVVVIMLGTNGTTSAMADGTGRQNRDQLLDDYGKRLTALRDLPSKPQVIVVSVPPVGPGLWYKGVPAMWELQATAARRHGLPFVDFHGAMHGLLSDVPTPNLQAVKGAAARRWFNSTDDAHTNTGPAMAKYYGKVCRAILAPTEWHELRLECSLPGDPAWKDAWLLAQCRRSAAPAGSKHAVGVQQSRVAEGPDPKHPAFTFEPIAGVQPSNKADGEVSFIRPAGGGTFFLLPHREHTLTFGRPYQILGDTPPAGDQAPAYAIRGRVVSGDNMGVDGVTVTLTASGGRSVTAKTTPNDAGEAGWFAFVGLTGDPAGMTIVVRQRFANE